MRNRSFIQAMWGIRSKQMCSECLIDSDNEFSSSVCLFTFVFFLYFYWRPTDLAVHHSSSPCQISIAPISCIKIGFVFSANHRRKKVEKKSECHDTHKCRLLSATQNLRKATGISCRSEHSRQPVWGLLKRWNDMRMRASYFRKFNVVWDDTDMFVYSVSFFVRLAIFIAPSSAVCADGMWCVGASHFGFLSSYNIVCIKYI